MQSSTRSSAFTLIELMIVVIIIAALAGMVVPRLLPRAEKARAKISRAEMANITTGLKFYRLDVGKYPSTEQGLDALISNPGSAPNWDGPYLEKKPRDPWGFKYRYQYPGTHGITEFDIWSVGPDGEEGTEDDVRPDEE
ncbi:MAG: type II secretion system major pseudopilin GspG [Kiritimatiellia bacterium]